MKSLQLSQIWVYPVKSLGGISLPSAQVRPKGLEHDRRWMLIDENGVFMTQRAYPKMALFQLHINGEQLMVTYKGDELAIPIHDHANGSQLNCTVWNDTVTVAEMSPTFNDWFSERLGLACRLVRFPESNPRPVDPAYRIHDDHVSLADGFPFLIIGQSSLDDLNSRLAQPVPMNRFRPNFVFTGGDPYEEDTWKDFTIGRNRFAGVKPCARCAIPTINQQTAEKGIEPSKTLATYRRRDNQVYFGQNVIALDYHTVSVGDALTF